MVQSSLEELPILPLESTAPQRWQFQAAFHQSQLLRVKKNLGKECLYLAHEQAGNKRFIRAIMLNSTGGKDYVPIEIGYDLNLFREKEYDAIQKTLGTKSYERDTETV